jgi:hypothetical protein
VVDKLQGAARSTAEALERVLSERGVSGSQDGAAEKALSDLRRAEAELEAAEGSGDLGRLRSATLRLADAEAAAAAAGDRVSLEVPGYAALRSPQEGSPIPSAAPAEGSVEPRPAFERAPAGLLAVEARQLSDAEARLQSGDVSEAVRALVELADSGSPTAREAADRRLRQLAASLAPSTGMGVEAAKGAQGWAFHDARIRLREYLAKLEPIPGAYRLPEGASLDTLEQNARQAVGERNAVLERSRELLSPEGRAYSEGQKSTPPDFEMLLKRSQKQHPDWSMEQHYRELIESAGRARTSTTALARAIRGAELAGRVGLVVGVATDSYSLGTEVDRSLQTGRWDNTGREAARIAGGWAGAWAVGKAGAAAGGAVGGLFGIVGAPIGAIIGGIGGGIVGYWYGGQAGTYYYDAAGK